MPALLTYALLAEPDPLRANARARLTLVVSNGGRQLVTAESITVTLPVGTTAKTLTANASGIATEPHDGWNVAQSGGVFTLTPKNAAAAKIGADGLAFVFANVAVNDQPGTCVVEIGETASAPAQPRAFRTERLPLPKFPARFELSALGASPTQLASGGSAVLMWHGSPATYTLSYDPSGAKPVRAPVGNAGPYTARNLTKLPSVTFTLEASVTVPGEDQPLVLQRQVTVDVSTSAPVIAAFTGTLSGGGGAPVQLELAWSVQGSGLHCWFSGSPYEVAPIGSATIPSATMPQQPTYTLNASNGSGSVAAALAVRWTSHVTTIPLAETPENIAVAKDGSRAYVCTERSVVVIDTNALAPAAPPKTFADALAFVNVSPDGTRLYVTSALRKTVTVLDAQTLEALGPPIAISVTPQRQGILAARAAVSPDGSRLFVPGGFAGNAVAVVDTIARTEIAAPHVESPLAAAVTPDGKHVFVSSLIGAVHVLDAVTLRPAGEPIAAGKLAIALVAAPDGARAFVLDSQLAEVVAIDTATRKTGPWIPLPSKAGRPPHALAITPDGSQLMCGGFTTLSLLDADPLRLVSTVALGGTASDVAVAQDGKTVLIAATEGRGAVVAYAPPYVEGGVPSKLTLYAMPPS
jgi:DNA-binding beta-propeller fold protein YncE